MNDFRRKYLDILKSTDYISSVARPGKEIVNIDYYVYNIRIGSDAVPIAAAATVPGLIEAQADSDFVLTYLSGGAQVAIAGNLVFNLPILLQFTDTGSGKTFFNTPTAIGIVCGAGGFPFLLPSPRVINPNTNISIAVTNNTAANVYGVYLALHGSRIYYAS